MFLAHVMNGSSFSVPPHVPPKCVSFCTGLCVDPTCTACGGDNVYTHIPGIMAVLKEVVFVEFLQILPVVREMKSR